MTHIEEMKASRCPAMQMSQAIPPAYTHFLGLQLRAYIESGRLLAVSA